MNRMLNVACRAWLALTVSLTLGGAARAQGVTDTSILLGQNLALQGGKNDYGVAAAQGMKLYIDQTNAAGGVHGRQILTRILDDDNKADIAEANARQLVKEGVFLLFGAIDGGPSLARWPAHPPCEPHTSHWCSRCAPNTKASFRPS